MADDTSIPMAHAHRVDVAAYRAPDGLTMIEVFVNGARVDANIHVVDPGRGQPYPLAEWRSRASAVGWGAGSDAWKRAVIGWYAGAESDYTINDLVTARDPQPDADEIALLDPARWIGDGQLSAAAGGPQLAEDNTIRAGRALFAVKAFHHRLLTGQLMDGMRDPARLVPPTVHLYEPAAHAVAAYAQLAMPTAGPEDLPGLVVELLTELHHLADAKDILLAMPPAPGQSPLALHTLMTGLVALLRVTSPAWAYGLDNDPAGPYEPRGLDNFRELLATACDRYRQQVTGNS